MDYADIDQKLHQVLGCRPDTKAGYIAFIKALIKSGEFVSLVENLHKNLSFVEIKNLLRGMSKVGSPQSKAFRVWMLEVLNAVGTEGLDTNNVRDGSNAADEDSDNVHSWPMFSSKITREHIFFCIFASSFPMSSCRWF